MNLKRTKKYITMKKYVMLHKINFHYFVLKNVFKYVQPNLHEVTGVFLCYEPLLSFGSMLI